MCYLLKKRRGKIRLAKNEGRCPVLRRVGVHDQKSVPKTGQRPQFSSFLRHRLPA